MNCVSISLCSPFVCNFCTPFILALTVFYFKSLEQSSVTPKAAMFNPRKKTSRKVGKEEQKRKGKAPMFTHRSGIFSKRAVSDDVAKPWAAVGTWFLGPKAENADVFIELMKDAIKAHMDFRQGHVTKFYFTVASYLRLLPWHGFLYQLLFRVCSLIPHLLFALCAT